jgi:fermentation-respiration switch protein FrsA (DUF1100 family)
MPPWARRLLFGAGTVGALGYGSAVGFLAFRETSLVYVGAGARHATRIVPLEAAVPWDTLRVPAADTVPVLLLESMLNDSAPWAIYFHGNFGLLGSRGNVRRYELLRDAGFNVLAVEYRGYGASVSAGTPSEQAINADAAAAWDYLTRRRGVDPRRIVIYGWSLGSGPATRLAAERGPAALITEGAFTSLPDVGAEVYPWVPVRLVMRNRFDNLELARTLSIPWIVFHGRVDDVVPFSHGESLAAASSHARLIPLAANHDDGVIGDRDKALAVLRDQYQRIARH